LAVAHPANALAITMTLRTPIATAQTKVNTSPTLFRITNLPDQFRTLVRLTAIQTPPVEVVESA
jgi:hypothetical protein